MIWRYFIEISQKCGMFRTTFPNISWSKLESIMSPKITALLLAICCLWSDVKKRECVYVGRVFGKEGREGKTIFRHSKIVNPEKSRQIPSDVREKCHNSWCEITCDRKVCETWVKSESKFTRVEHREAPSIEMKFSLETHLTKFTRFFLFCWYFQMYQRPTKMSFLTKKIHKSYQQNCGPIL
jgi:hypothetical protein